MSNILIQGAGIAGQVLHQELALRGIPSRIEDRSEFPREKVCGGILQWDSWEYLKSIFKIHEKALTIPTLSHFWRTKRISRIRFDQPMVYVSRFNFDDELYRQRDENSIDDQDILRINAAGVSGKKGEWIGFQGESKPVAEFEMHYGRGIYLGISPLTTERAHTAFIMKRSLFKDVEQVRDLVQKELGIRILSPLKGMGRIHYGYSGEDLAVGDAMMTAHPFLGLGMKHAIWSARLMADLIEQGRVQDYSGEHHRRFWKLNWASRITSMLYDSPGKILLWPLLRYSFLFLPLYRWAHESQSCLTSCGSGGGSTARLS